MTQDVQPLTWQKRTNLEEHQQFFSKINEIIGNLAPTVDEAEAAVATANAASAAASAAASQAQTAASQAQTAASQTQTAAATVAGYGTRLTAAEGGIDALQAADGQNVKISRINEYAVGLTGNQDNIAGIKSFVETIRGRVTNVLYAEYSGNLPDGKYRQFAKIPANKPNTMIVLDVMTSANANNYGLGRVIIGNPTATTWFCQWVYRESNGVELDATSIQIAKETATGDLLIFALNPVVTGLAVNLVYSKYGFDIQDKPRVEKVTNTIDYSLDGTDAGIENIIPGSDTNNVKINKINEYAVGLTGNQNVSGEKSFINNIIKKINIPGGTSPENYSSNWNDWMVIGNDGMRIISCGHEKSNTSDVTRLIFSIFANTNIETNKQPYVQIHYIYDETNKKLVLKPAHIDKNGNITWGAEQVLLTW